MDEVRKSKTPAHQLNLLYLANEIIQNGKRRGTVPEFIKGFESVLPPALAACGKAKEPTIHGKIQRMINIWETRKLFNSKFILSLRQSLTKGVPVAVRHYLYKNGFHS